MTSLTQENIDRFEIKVIEWSDYNFQSPTLLQDENGPCPLISLINTLVLNFEVQNKELVLDNKQLNSLETKKHEGVKALRELLLRKEQGPGFIELNETLSQLGDLLLEFAAKKDSNYDVDSLLKSLPELHTGLSVNPNLSNGGFPSTDLSSQLFEIFDLKFRHGWCFGQDGIKSSGVPNVGSSKSGNLFEQFETFDEIQDYLLKNVNDGVNEEQRIVIQENQSLLSNWLDANRTQLTDSGLEKLNRNLIDGEFVVFFRNNHFNTLLKKSDMEFYLLITDASFKSNKIVWQSLNSVNGGDDLFFNGEFSPILDNADGQNSPDNEDYSLTKKLQEEEDARIAQEMNQNYMKKQKKNENNRNHGNDRRSSDAKKSTKKDKKKSICCIV